MQYENELIALSSLSSSLVQSPIMKQSLRFAIYVVMKVMEVEVALTFSLEEETNELVLMAYEGVPWEFAQSVDRVRLGESFNGRVAETGEPLVVGDTPEDPGLSSGELRRQYSLGSCYEKVSFHFISW
jgi:signal transduction protein with GAF and PtsI domain